MPVHGSCTRRAGQFQRPVYVTFQCQKCELVGEQLSRWHLDNCPPRPTLEHAETPAGRLLRSGRRKSPAKPELVS